MDKIYIIKSKETGEMLKHKGSLKEFMLEKKMVYSDSLRRKFAKTRSEDEFHCGWKVVFYGENPVDEQINPVDEQIDRKNVLVIPDLHIPFTEVGALKFVKDIYEENNISEVVFLGDILDKTADSYHEREMDSKSIQDEMNESIEILKGWYRTFPNAIVIMGNHDRMYTRKAKTGGIPSHWLKDINDVLQVPNWKFVPNYTYKGWFFTHGEQLTALTRASKLGMSVAQGHRHSEMYLRIASINKNKVTWGLQLGALIDHNSFAFNYAKDGKPIAKGVAIIKNIGTTKEKIEIIPFIKSNNSENN